jgi:mutator protein MutT
VLALLNPMLLAAALQAAAGPAGPAGPAEQAPPADPPGPDAPASPFAPANPETTGPVVVGPVDAVLGEHEVAVEMRGSPESMARQHAVAVASELSFAGTLEEMEVLAEEGVLVPIKGGRHYEVMDWVFPYGLPEVRTFVERLAAQYREACGEALVVTSLTRPFSEQPRNAHQLSVHPAGMAVDFRIPQTPACRAFMDERLLEKEAAGLIDVTHERSPPHFHVAVYPEPYAQWAALQPRLDGVGPDPVRELLPDEPGGVLLWLALGLALLAVAGLAAGWIYRRSRRRRAGPAAGAGHAAGAGPVAGDAVTPVLAAVIRRGDRYLLARRPAHKRHGGLWEFPGGKLEAGESWLDAARRELREELGVAVTGVAEPVYRRRDLTSPFEIVFVEVEIDGEPVALEHEEVRWVAAAEMATLELAPADAGFAARLGAASPFRRS